MRNYLTLALKVLTRRKFFTFISLFGVSVTLLVLMVFTAIADNVFSARAPESRFDRVLCAYTVGWYGDGGMSHSGWPSYAFLDKYVRTLPGAERVSLFTTPEGTAIYKDGRRTDATLRTTDGEYWRILDFRFLEGRGLTAADDAQGAYVAVISDKLREQVFGKAKAEGQTISIDGRPFRVVGVVRRVAATRFAAYADLWIPLSTLAPSGYKVEMLNGHYQGIVLAKSRADFPRLRREFATRVAAIKPIDPRFTTVKSSLDSTFEFFARMFAPGNQYDPNRVLFTASFFSILALLFMALPALNLVTIGLSRILERSSEIGVRKAFGAPRGSLIRQFVLENLVLTFLGALIGFVLSGIVLAILNGTVPIVNGALDLNFRIFFYAMLIAAFFGIVSGIYPAWCMSRLHPVAALRGGVL
jgi:putative ABC transport system permease protein